MKKILRIVNTLDPSAGGIVAGVTQATSHLETLNIGSEFLTFDSPSSKFLDDFKYKYYAIGPSLLNYSFVFNAPKIIAKLAPFYDHIFVEGLWQYHSYAAWLALRNANTPYSVFTHGMLDPWFNKTYPVKRIKKVIYWNLFEYYVLRDASYVIFTTDIERQLARKSFSRYKAKEFVSGYGADPPGTADQDNSSLFFDHFPHLIGKRILLFVGRIHEKKGIDLLLKAFSVIKAKENLHIVLVGPLPNASEYYKYLLQLIDDLSLSSYVTWTGLLTGSLKWSAFNAAELFCLTSHQENFGVVVAEALSCSLPVLISDSVNIYDVIQSNSCGLVCTPSFHGVADSLNTWLTADTTTRLQYSFNAKQTFVEHFDFASVSRKLLSII